LAIATRRATNKTFNAAEASPAPRHRGDAVNHCRRRPACLAAAPFAGGLAAAALLRLPLWPLVAGALALAVAALFLLNRRAGSWVLLGALALAGAAWFGARRDYLERDDVAFRLDRGFGPGEAVVTGVVSSDPEDKPYGTVFALRLESMTAGGETAKVGGGARVTVYDRIAVRYGDRLAVAGKVSAPKPARNPGGFDYRSYLGRCGITALVAASRADDVALLGRGRGNAILAAAFAARHKAASVLDRAVGGEEAALLNGLTLGKRAEIDPAVLEDFRGAGTMHLLAISGFNVGLVAFMLFLVLAGTRMPKVAANLTVMAFLPAFALITGFNPPVVRASLMGMLVLAAALLDRDVDLFNVLAAAALILLIYNPLYVGDASFLLSFAAVFAIAALYRPISNFLRPVPAFIRETFAVTCAAQLGVLPLQLYFFYRFTPTALVSNLIMVPLAGCAVALALTTILTGAVWPALGDLYGSAAWLAARVLIAAAHIFSRGLAPLLGPDWDFQFWVGRPSPFLFLLVILGIAAGLARPKRWRVAFGAAALGCLGLWLAPRLAAPGPPLRITFLDVGQADSALVEFPGGETLLVDAGYAGGGYDAGERVVAPFLRSRGINSLDYLCVTHGDADHAGGAAYVIREFDVGELWLPAGGKPSPALDEVIAAAAARRTRTSTGAPERVLCGGVDVVRVWPPAGGAPAEFSRNNSSTVLRLSWRNFAALLAADAEQPAQELIIESGKCCRADVVKVPHHGSAGAAWPPFVAAVNPRAAFFPTKSGAKKFPAAEALALYRAAGARRFAAGEKGAAVVQTDGRRLRVRTMY
jgi:competence protein ComEC